MEKAASFGAAFFVLEFHSAIYAIGRWEYGVEKQN
jgi:hypothetical protein